MRISPSANAVLERIASRQELILVGLLVLTVGMMILPVPAVLADVLIASNIGLAFLLMMVAVYISAPVQFSTFPTVILITTAFRLSLSITTSRLVLAQGDAGEIIRTFGEFVIGGNVVVGLVVYLIITIVQFVVITKGSERVAEVAARFTLDALPGKQISIDTDLKNGDIDPNEARLRRQALGKESQLYGAMDGAMKFVKGDAIASLVIIVVNLIGGITIGCLERGLPLGQAVQTYSLLAVGDGLIAQIPALLISLTAGIIVTRAASDDGNNLGGDIISQLTSEPKTLQIGASVLGALAFVPNFPAAVFLVLAILLGTAGWVLAARKKDEERRFAEAGATSTKPEAAQLLLHLSGSFDEAVDRTMDAVRLDLGRSLGIAVPRVQIAGDRLADPGTWRLDVSGVPAGHGKADNIDDLVHHARQSIGRIASQFVGIQETQILLASMEPAYTDLVREATKAAPLVRMAEILRRLLDEGVSVSNLRSILEAVAEWGPREQNTAVLTEHVRVGLRRQICHALAGPERILSVILIDAPLDAALRGAIHATPAGTQLLLDPAASNRLLAALHDLATSTPQAAILASSEIRRHLRSLLHRAGNDLPVVTHAELPQDFKLDVLGTLRHDQIMPATAEGRREPPHLVAVGERA
ncbi:FHIPEP family type III secretion protein [Bradyrhizobium sp. STM 3557]|uniref:FHIPEP family type III secretion protein n=1 Tax=Bradyrhizobium sp. STM 3557 TaxID=578920 RepID=UPI00388E0CEF